MVAGWNHQLIAVKYFPADSQKEVYKLELPINNKENVYDLLVKYNSLFDGTLGVWNSSPIWWNSNQK